MLTIAEAKYIHTCVTPLLEAVERGGGTITGPFVRDFLAQILRRKLNCCKASNLTIHFDDEQTAKNFCSSLTAKECLATYFNSPLSKKAWIADMRE